MPHDPIRIDETRAWFKRARNDLRAGEVDLGAVPPLTADACFHAQQAAEKRLKGFLCWHLRPVPKTHDIKDIGESCAEIAPGLSAPVQRAVKLTEYAWRFRYPGDDAEPSSAEARDALERAAGLLAAVLQVLPHDVAP